MKMKRGSTGVPEQDMENRQALLEGSLEQVFNTYDNALDEEVADPVVFLLDCEDEIGGPMAVDWVGESELRAAIAENRSAAQREEITTTLGVAFAFDECRDAITESFPYLLPSFETAPTSGFLAVVVASGGAATFTVPFSARPEDE